jgi:hypothetical protein
MAVATAVAANDNPEQKIKYRKHSTYSKNNVDQARDRDKTKCFPYVGILNCELK